MDVAKAGSLLRLSSVLRKWKSCWFVLTVGGELHFWESEQAYFNRDASQGKVIIRDEVKAIVGGRSCHVDAPETRTKDCLLGLKRKGGDQTVYLCAESSDDMSAWLFMLDQARTIQNESTNSVSAVSDFSGPPPPYIAGNSYQAAPAGGYAQPAASTSYAAQYPPPYPVQQGGPSYTYYPPGVTYVPPGATYMYPQPKTTVIIRDDCYHRGCNSSADLAGGMALGMATGAMMGAMMMPFWFF